MYSGSRSLWKETGGFCEQQLILHHVTTADKLGGLYSWTGHLLQAMLGAMSAYPLISTHVAGY